MAAVTTPTVSTEGRSRQMGLTLLEVLIALSIFALIGVASFRVLSSVIDTQKTGDRYSRQLATFQKALFVLDRDLQQYVERPVRNGPQQELPALMVGSGDYPLELTRIGWANPLLLPRSALQRVAYDIGPHPQADNPDSVFYGDKRQYLRRIYWPVLDRREDVKPKIQALIPDVEELQVSVVTDRGQFNRWPPAAAGKSGEMPTPKALKLSLVSAELGAVTRLYKIESHGQ